MITSSFLPEALLAERPHLFSAAAVPVAAADLARMAELIAAVERVVALPQWRERAANIGTPGVLPAGRGGDTAAGVFMGYDFHLTDAGPQLIEINTNAGGGLLAVAQAGGDEVLDAYVAMFRAECGAKALKALAIVDERPETQYLYPEFLAFRELFARHGIAAVICDPTDLLLCHGSLWHEETRLDLVYNRVTDFALAQDANVVLKEAWLQGAAAVTPNPRHHALYADKRNLVALTDDGLLAGWGVDADTRRVLAAGIPRTEIVEAARGEDFWVRRKQLFFKPAAGFGSRAAYRGDKLTKRVFEEILAGDYVAQALALPSAVAVEVDGEMTELKADIRNYAYRGAVQFVAARLYQGQTTNFRTPGGGFARVVEASR
ncbi:hypothetical protein [Sulfurisoma sediminicola]|uniref:Uncharacterized protein n=1 Tax=Sulfurisoma sediminicola TaxID=1381557 RepID=A0A497X8U5_9PROT|nr:hypothetical protein [Sulfurisoma sediminicola]RLJ62652.1 hypothetical protein DFR35_2465 [Sulfurisoma sediminicola]